MSRRKKRERPTLYPWDPKSEDTLRKEAEDLGIPLDDLKKIYTIRQEVLEEKLSSADPQEYWRYREDRLNYLKAWCEDPRNRHRKDDIERIRRFIEWEESQLED